ncbi:hypothetical protein AB0I00_31975 [Streptomyces sp. NPDC050803]|uniref:hypothetical protein n=1 Tax=unclassified Streptomyces TaxID=2593676 RepID=UPI00343DDF12
MTKKILIAGALLAVVCAGAGAAAYAAFTEEDTAVSVQTEPVRTRAYYVELWKEQLAKSGKELPADVDSMTRQEILDELAGELARHSEPE